MKRIKLAVRIYCIALIIASITGVVFKNMFMLSFCVGALFYFSGVAFVRGHL